MSRKVLALAGIAALVFLSGCSYDTTLEVAPEIGDIESTGADQYRVDVTATLDSSVDRTFSDVRVHGYSLTGERVCTARYGDIASSESKTMTCERFPTLIVSDTGDRGKTVESSGLFSSRTYTVTGIAVQYMGKGPNGSHSYGTLEVVDGRPRKFDTERSELVPTGETLSTLKCMQWRRDRDGANYSVIRDRPWFEWEQRPPETNRTYRILFRNYTKMERYNRTDQVDIDPETPVHSIRSIHPAVRRTLQSTAYPRSNTINQTTFYEVIGNLSGQRVDSGTDLSTALQEIPGLAGEYENAAIDCYANPPRYDYDNGQWVKLFVNDGETTWLVHVRTEEHYSGRAFSTDTSG